MSLELDLFNTLRALVPVAPSGGRVYPDVAPAGVAKPYIVWQQVGGRAFNFVENTPVGKRNARIQVACWSPTRSASNDLARAVEDALVVSTLKATVLGAFSADYERDTGLYGTRQDFSVHY